MPPSEKSLMDLVRKLSKEEILTLIAERTLLWRVTERDILLARIEVLQKKADAHFEKYLSLSKKMPDHGAGIKDTIAFYTALGAREEELKKYDKCQKKY